LALRSFQELASKVRFQIEKAGSDRLEKILEDRWDFVFQ